MKQKLLHKKFSKGKSGRFQRDSTFKHKFASKKFTIGEPIVKFSLEVNQFNE